MRAGNWPIEFRQGETFHRPLSWVVKDQTTGVKTVVETAGGTALLHVRARPGHPTVLLECSTANGRIVLGGNPWNIVLDVPADVTAALAWGDGGRAVYDLFITATPTVTCLLTGTATLQYRISTTAGVALLTAGGSLR